jgi:hypothetical protein
MSLAVDTPCAIWNKSFKLITNYAHVPNIVGSMTLVMSMLAFIIITGLHVGNMLAILLDCLTFSIGVFYFTEAVMMEVRQLASQSTTPNLSALALLFSAGYKEIAAGVGMIHNVGGKATWLQLEDIWFNFSLTRILRHEDMRRRFHMGGGLSHCELFPQLPSLRTALYLRGWDLLRCTNSKPILNLIYSCKAQL